MKIVKTLRQSVLHRVHEQGPKRFFVLSVLQGFEFGKPGLLLEPDLWKTAAEALAPGGLLDMGNPKPAAEVLAAGKAFAPGGNPVQVLEASLSLGSVKKTLNVFGDSRWEKKAGAWIKAEPEPFTEMETTWAKAFGGPDFPDNPLGKGHVPQGGDPAGTTLHNVAATDEKLDEPWDVTRSASFGSLDMAWPQRQQYAGTYGDAWMAERFPFFPEDMDQRLFHAAQEDQRFPSYLTGDENFELKHMHPEESILSGRLPGYRPRAFVKILSRGNEFEELHCKLDTVWLFPNLKKGVLVHRAMCEIQTDDTDDVAALLLAHERLDAEQIPMVHYLDQFAKRTNPEHEALYVMREHGLVPPGEERRITDDIENAEDYASQGKMLANFSRRAEKEKQAALDRAKEMIAPYGLAPAVLTPEPVEDPFPVIDPEACDPAEFKAAMDKAQAMADEAKDKAFAKARTLCKQQGMDFDQLAAEAAKRPPGPPKIPDFDMEAALAAARQAGVDTSSIENKLAETRERLDKAQQASDDAYKRFAQHYPEPEPLAEDERQRLRAFAADRLTRTNDFSGLDLCGADLSGLNLRGANLKDALLEGADLSGANLENADLSGAVLAHAVLCGANMKRTKAAGANLGASDLAGANLTDADLQGAMLGKSRFTHALLNRANLERAEILEADLAGASLSGAKLRHAMFNELDFAGMDFSSADLSEAVFIKCDMAGADFSGATAKGTIFITCDLSSCLFRKASLESMRVLAESKAERASFVDASLKECNLMQADLRGAEFSGADLGRANLMQADLREAAFHHVRARQANFMKADLRGAAFTRADLMEASFMKARLGDAKFHGTSLYGAEVFRSKLDETTDFTGANLTLTKIEGWTPEWMQKS
jgi:uncharacterized protein YjbI with pentapeptide repeats